MDDVSDSRGRNQVEGCRGSRRHRAAQPMGEGHSDAVDKLDRGVIHAMCGELLAACIGRKKCAGPGKGKANHMAVGG